MFNIALKITLNNILILVSNSAHKSVFILTGGQLVPKLKGRKKVSTVAAKLLGNLLAKKLKTKKCNIVSVYVFGNAKRRKVILAEVWKVGIKIQKIIDLTPLPHNGCRLRKIKRT